MEDPPGAALDSRCKEALHWAMRALPFVLVLAAAPLGAQEVVQVPYAGLEGELTSRIDFETYPRIPSPGDPLDGVAVHDGASFAERFRGQVITQEAGFDVLRLPPAAPLSLEAGAPGQNLAVVYLFFMSNQLKGMAPPGFPRHEAGGEGAVAVLFDRDQSALGFRVTSEPRPDDATVPKGRMQVAFYRRDGSLIDRLEVVLEWELAGYGFRRADEVADIAGIAITNRDPAGVAIDDVIFDRDLVLGGLAGRGPTIVRR